MKQFALPDAPAAWRSRVRALLAAELGPEQLDLVPEGTALLFGETLPETAAPGPRVPRSFLPLLERLLCASSEDRHRIAYGLLWRLTHGEPKLLERPSDPLVSRARRLEQAVRRETHKAKAFVRFRPTADGTLVAFHRPTHRVLRLVARFFTERFACERFAILTPEESLHWDGERAHFGPGASAPEHASPDEAEELWLAYYAAIFNPARIKTRAMVAEMPKKHWPTLPETALIPELLRSAPARLEAMRAKQPPSARELAREATDLGRLQTGLSGCELCPRRVPRGESCVVRSPRAVTGVGAPRPRLVVVGEQPGDQEDQSGLPFVGPAGEVLDEALAKAGLQRSEIWLTNAVKHFHHREGPARVHARPSADVVERCRPWLERELDLLVEAPVLCLGETAALSVLGRRVKVGAARGSWTRGLADRAARVSFHPASALRTPGERETITEAIAEDLRQAAQGSS